MANIKLARIDYRLIHGQVITTWVKRTDINKIIIINDELANDDFMTSIYTMSAPPGIDVTVYSVSQAKKVWEENEFGSGNVFLLFRNCEEALLTLEAGVKYSELNVGGIAKEPGKQTVIGPVSLSKEEFNMLKKIDETGVDVYVQVLPGETKFTMSQLVKNLKFGEE